MTDQQPISSSFQPDPLSGGRPSATAMSASDRAAIHAGVRAGDAALAQSRLSGVLSLFMEVWHAQVAAPRLKALRNYAELRRVMLPLGHEVPATSLVAAGFTAAEIADIDMMIAVIPPGTGLALGPDRHDGHGEVGR